VCANSNCCYMESDLENCWIDTLYLDEKVPTLRELIIGSEKDTMAIRLIGKKLTTKAVYCYEEKCNLIYFGLSDRHIGVDSTAVIDRTELCHRCDSIYHLQGLQIDATPEEAALAFLNFSSKTEFLDWVAQYLCSVSYEVLDSSSKRAILTKSVCDNMWLRIRGFGAKTWSREWLGKFASGTMSKIESGNNHQGTNERNKNAGLLSKTLSPRDNGYAWNAASSSERWEFCRQLWWKTGLHDATYYHDLLTDFYSSDNSHILAEEISFVLGLAEALQ